MNKLLHTRTEFIRGIHKASLKINQKGFKALDVIGDDLFEVDTSLASIAMDLPLYIGFEILQNSKIRMLSFIYDFLTKYIERLNFNCVLSDTDSIYIALTHEQLKDTVKPHLKGDFNNHLMGYCGPNRHPDAYLCRQCCETHAFIDSKTPNLFKVIT